MKKLKEILFPSRCCSCDRITETLKPVCEECRSLVLHPSQSKSRCDICGFSHDDCICKKRQFFDKISVSFHYEGSAKKTIFKLKFRARPDIAKNHAELMFSLLNERNMTDDIDIITFIPMSSFARFRRGYNQSELMARHLSHISGIPCAGLLQKTGKTSSQHSLSKIARTGNLLGIFEPVKEQIPLIQNKTILIVDDVITTGSTVNEIAKTLLIFGADSVYVSACMSTKNSAKKH